MFSYVWDFLSTEGFQPHGICLLWRSDVFWAQVVSDMVIAVSYFSIPTALLYLASRRSDLVYGWMLYLFGAFIIACGITHLFGIWTMWVPDYGEEAIAKVLTALVSAATAIALWPMMPKLLAIPSARQLEAKNDALAREVDTRIAAEENLQALNEDLERRVMERTEALATLNEELVRSRSAAEEANGAKSEFLAKMSHELRTPLNAIIGFSELIKDSPDRASVSDKYRAYADHIHQSSHHLLDLINDVLDLAKIEAGGEDLYEESVDIDELLSEMTDLFSAIAKKKKNVVLEVKMIDGPAALRADRRKLKQILINLLSNSVKHTPAGGRIALTAHHNDVEGCVFQVIDTGTGIAAEDIPRAFMPFQQIGASSSTQHDGTGLGLPLTKGLVNLHGGSLDLQSDLGAGTTVTVRFPPRRLVVASGAAESGASS